MLTWILAVFLTLFCASARACEPNQECSIDLSNTNIQSLVNGINTFTNQLMNTMFTDTSITANVLLSPLGVYVALVLVMLGADGVTQNELVTALGLSQTNLRTVPDDLATIVNAIEVARFDNNGGRKITFETVALGQAFFLQRGYRITERYYQLLRNFRALAASVDFANDPTGATMEIDRWIAGETGDRIGEFISTALPRTTALLIATTVYFSAMWEANLFDATSTTTVNFHAVSGTYPVQMMSTTKTLSYYDERLSYSAVQLPYGGGDYTLLVVLPYGDINPQDFVSSFTIQEYKNILQNSQDAYVNVQLPKIDTLSSGSLVKYLKTMGINRLFATADLSEMINNADDRLKVWEVLQAAEMSIDEVGTVASSATAVIGSATSAAPTNQNPISFIVNRPHLLFNRHVNSDLIVFCGFIREVTTN